MNREPADPAAGICRDKFSAARIDAIGCAAEEGIPEQRALQTDSTFAFAERSCRAHECQERFVQHLFFAGQSVNEISVNLFLRVLERSCLLVGSEIL